MLSAEFSLLSTDTRPDWHVHSRFSPCGHRLATLDLIATDAKRHGIAQLGVCDHLHGTFSLTQIRACRDQYDSLTGRFPGMRLGVEVSVIRRSDLECRATLATIRGHDADWIPTDLALCISEELVAELRLDYVVGAAHWALGANEGHKSVMEAFHTQMLFIASHPCVDILAHPWCCPTDRHGVWDPTVALWLMDFRTIPRSMHDELCAAALQYGTAVEVNARLIDLGHRCSPQFAEMYMDYLCGLYEAGVQLAFGSDCHDCGYTPPTRVAESYIQCLEMEPRRWWRPAGGATDPGGSGSHG